MEIQNNFFNIHISSEIPKQELIYIQQILTCLENTYKSTDKEIRKKSYKRLCENRIFYLGDTIRIFLGDD